MRSAIATRPAWVRHAPGRFAAATAACLAGCASGGGSPEVPAVDVGPKIAAIALCRTTEADLRREFGTPSRDGRLRDARILSWITGQGGDGVTHYLAAMLDAQGRVVDLYWDLPTEIPWMPSDQCRAR